MGTAVTAIVFRITLCEIGGNRKDFFPPFMYI
jgi:hypothetical protein